MPTSENVMDIKLYKYFRQTNKDGIIEIKICLLHPFPVISDIGRNCC